MANLKASFIDYTLQIGANALTDRIAGEITLTAMTTISVTSATLQEYKLWFGNMENNQSDYIISIEYAANPAFTLPNIKFGPSTTPITSVASYQITNGDLTSLGNNATFNIQYQQNAIQNKSTFYTFKAHNPYNSSRLYLTDPAMQYGGLHVIATGSAAGFYGGGLSLWFGESVTNTATIKLKIFEVKGVLR